MPLLLLVLFIGLPIAELYVIVKVGESIGVLSTLALLVAQSLIGVALVRRQGRAAWQRFRAALAENRLPHREVFDGAMVLLGGALLVTPGFITAVLGIICLLPPTRALIWLALKRIVVARVAFGPRVAYGGYQRARERRAGPQAGPEPGWPPPPPAPGTQRPPAPEAQPGDIEGTAHELPDDPPELPR